MFKKINYLRFIGRVNKINNACASIDISEDVLFFVYHIVNQPFIWKDFKNITANRYCKAQIICASLMIVLKTFMTLHYKIDNARKQTLEILEATIVSVSYVCKLTKDETLMLLQQTEQLNDEPEFIKLSLREYTAHIATIFAPAIYLCKEKKRFCKIQLDKVELVGFTPLVENISEITIYLKSISEYTIKIINDNNNQSN